VVVAGRLLLRLNEVVPEAVDPNHGLLGVKGARGEEAVEAWAVGVGGQRGDRSGLGRLEVGLATHRRGEEEGGDEDQQGYFGPFSCLISIREQVVASESFGNYYNRSSMLDLFGRSWISGVL
jgi:hypothetical protein